MAKRYAGRAIVGAGRLGTALAAALGEAPAQGVKRRGVAQAVSGAQRRGRTSSVVVSGVRDPAEGGKRDSVNTSIWLTDPLKPEERRKLAELPGGGWEATTVSPDRMVLPGLAAATTRAFSSATRCT